MPLFTFQCRKCGTVFEALVDSHAVATTGCRNCGAAARKHAVARFSVGGRRPAGGGSALRATSSEFVSNPDSFVSAMDSFGDKVGSKLTDRQMERAVERIKTMKR